VPAVKYKELRAPSYSEDSASVRGRVLAAKNKQTERFNGDKKTYCNAQMAPKLSARTVRFPRSEKLLENAVTRLGLSARAHDRNPQGCEDVCGFGRITGHHSEAS